MKAQIVQKIAKSPTAGKLAQKASTTLSKPSVQKGLLYGGMGILALYLGRKAFLKVRKNSTERNFDDPTVQHAMALRSAFNPSGLSWSIAMDGTLEKPFFETVEQITDFEKVIKNYNKLYNDSLMERAQKELGEEDYKRFMYMVSTSTPDGRKKNQKFILLPKGGKIYHSLRWYPFGSVKEAEPNSFLSNPTDMKIVSYWFGSFIHSKQLNTTDTKAYDVWVNMDNVVLADVATYKAKYKQTINKKVVFTDEDFQ